MCALINECHWSSAPRYWIAAMAPTLGRGRGNKRPHFLFFWFGVWCIDRNKHRINELIVKKQRMTLNNAKVFVSVCLSELKTLCAKYNLICWLGYFDFNKLSKKTSTPGPWIIMITTHDLYMVHPQHILCLLHHIMVSNGIGKLQSLYLTTKFHHG